MRTLTILCASIVLFVLGVVIEDRGFAVDVGDSGEIIYPLSSAGEDGLLLKMGLYPFILAILSAAISLAGRGKGRVTFGIFSGCSIFYCLMVILVSLDSNIFESAMLGDWLPLAANTIWVASLAVVFWLSFNKRQQDQISARS